MLLFGIILVVIAASAIIVNGKVKVYQLWENKSVPPLWERNGL
jgi:hypothetical protein